MKLPLLLALAAVFALAPEASAQKGSSSDAWYGIMSKEGVQLVQAASLKIQSRRGRHVIQAGRQRVEVGGEVSILMVGVVSDRRAKPEANAVAACANALPLALKMGPPQQARRGTSTSMDVDTRISDDGKTTTTTTTTTTTDGSGTTTTTTTTTSPADPLGECPTSR